MNRNRSRATSGPSAGQGGTAGNGLQHWHGAAPDSFMEHLAIIDQADDPAASTTWLEHVRDEDYLA